MELAIGLGFEGIQLTAYAVNSDGEAVGFPLKDLYKRGLPTCAKPARRRIDTNLASWRVVDGQAYLDAFGFKGCQATEINHQFFEVKSSRRTHIVPALALMRALFRPTKNLLPEMFMPQALDRQCRLAVSESKARVEVDAPWATKAIAEQSSDWRQLFTWLMAHPSAYEMAGSVHAQAMEGEFGLQLPMAEMRMVFRGMGTGTTMFVTDVSITTITPQDERLFDMQDSTSVVTLFDRKVPLGKKGTFGSITSHLKVPCHCNGSSELNDTEWTRIEPILLSARQRPREFELSQRELLNGVLHKLASGQPWKEVAYTTGSWSNAYTAFRRWSARGTFDKVLSALTESRSAP